MENSMQAAKGAIGFRSDIFQGIMRLVFQDHPQVIRQVWRDLKEHRKAVKEGKWRPLR